ncbi:uncharacterized protein LOC116268260 [Nymphaea colorata]|nr:uncharacterized protein LOC116268260 [Nymphaea colorata]
MGIHIQEAGHKMSNLNWEKALDDLSKIKDHFTANSQSVSVVGFCMGGALTFAALSRLQGWKAGGVFYGIPDLNIFRLDKITANVIAHFGGLDPLQGFSDAESAKRLMDDCKRNNYPISVVYNDLMKDSRGGQPRFLQPRFEILQQECKRRCVQADEDTGGGIVMMKDMDCYLKNAEGGV